VWWNVSVANLNLLVGNVLGSVDVVNDGCNNVDEVNIDFSRYFHVVNC